MWPILSGLSKFRALRGSVLDPFSRTLERRMERELADDFKTTMTHALSQLDAANANDVKALAALFASACAATAM